MVVAGEVQTSLEGLTTLVVGSSAVPALEVESLCQTQSL